ncbi:MAG: hypothetical protein IKN83_10085 [Bacteroidaceae bacterium]|nr:hypothetical protein [Bacteroidaceae bacterium]
MKKLYVLFVFLLVNACAFATDLKEDFETGLPTSAPSSETTVTLASGDWKIKGVYAKKDNGSMRATMNSSGSYLISPSLHQPGRVTFFHRASGSGKKLTVEKSVDGGSSWVELGTSTISSSTPYGSSSFKVNSTEDDESVLIRFTCQNATIYLDDITITLDSATPDIPTEPEDSTYITVGVPIPTKPFPKALHSYYIAPDGNDATGDGSIEKPWLNLQFAVDKAEAGDEIICRGGTYRPTMKKDGQKYTVRISKSGTAEAPIVIRSYEDEKPVIDFEQQLRDQSVGDRGILLTGDYWWLFGLHITHAADNGIKLEGSHNRIERCEFSYNLDTGLQLGFGHDFSESGHGSSNDGSWCAYNDIIDCDSHHNCDYDSNYGSDADGFACKMHNGKGNRFIRCRAWHNSDDAWDLYETDYSVVLVECWAWDSGKVADHQWVKDYITKSGSMSFSGNGNGIKLGGNGTGGSSKGIHYAYNCIAFNCNSSSSVKGFDCNNHKGGHVLVGCLAFNNGYDYMFESGGSSANTQFYNNICLGRQEICVGTDDYNAIATPMSKNGWSHHLVTGIGMDDFVSLDEDDALKPRSIDGSLPHRFGRLAADSKMVDAGSADDDIPEELIKDFPFLKRTITGTTRDLGPYERTESTVNAVEEIEAFDAEPRMQNDGVYNLCGQRVSKPSKGIYIVNGKKVAFSIQ